MASYSPDFVTGLTIRSFLIGLLLSAASPPRLPDLLDSQSRLHIRLHGYSPFFELYCFPGCVFSEFTLSESCRFQYSGPCRLANLDARLHVRSGFHGCSFP